MKSILKKLLIALMILCIIVLGFSSAFLVSNLNNTKGDLTDKENDYKDLEKNYNKLESDYEDIKEKYEELIEKNGEDSENKKDEKSDTEDKEDSKSGTEDEDKDKNENENENESDKNGNENNDKKSEEKTDEKTTGTEVEKHGQLSVSGTDIVDKNGDKYRLKGVSTHGLSWYPEYINKECFKDLRDNWNVNVIRLAMYTDDYNGYCSGGNKEELKKLVKNGIDYATELGMYVIVDWHVLSEGNPLTYKGEAINFFNEISSEYRNNDNIIYEICNEPNGSATWNDVKQYAYEVIPVIRENDEDAVIIVGTGTWSQDVDVAADDSISGYENIVYALHFYAATHKDDIRNKLTKAHDAGLCVVVSEFCICDASGNGSLDYGSASSWFELLDKYNTSFIGWNLSNKDESSALFNSGCTKTSGFEDGDLSEWGKYYKDLLNNK